MRLLFLITGGTVLMQPAKNSARLTLDTDGAADAMLRELPSLSRVAEIETRILFNMDSADMQPAHWITIAREVHAALSSGKYAGVVIVHGTDTMAYTASALAFLLGPLPAPVVLTGAQRPLVEARTDARQNLVDAALVATLRVPEVTIAFGARALRGVRSTKRDAWAFDAFDTPGTSPLVELGAGVDVMPHVRTAGTLAPLDDRIEPRVLAVRVFPGLDPALVSGAIGTGLRGLVLEAFGTGSIPYADPLCSLIPAIERATARNVPVLIVSQCFHGRVDLARYDGGSAAERAGAISGFDMTVEAALAKMMIGLGRFGPGDDLRSYLTTNTVGERNAFT